MECYRARKHTPNALSIGKLGVLKGLVLRAHLLCDIKEDLLNNLELLRNIFICNGYRKKLVEKTINDSWKGE